MKRRLSTMRSFDSTRPGLLILVAIGLLFVGCRAPGSATDATNAPSGDMDNLKTADTGFTTPPTEPNGQTAPPPSPKSYDLAILHVLIPREGLADADKIWNYIREDVFDADAQARFRENGLRVGVGRAEWWEPIKAVLDAVEGHKVTMATPVHLPLGFPLLLEMDVEPQEQTIFYVGPDGILTGNTWPQSRNVLRVAYAPDPQNPENIVLYAVPEVHRENKDWQWIRSEAGLRQDPRESMETFNVAGVTASLAPGEFLLLTPSENSQVYGMLGGAFLTRVSQGRQFCSFVFLRPEARTIGQQ